MQLFLRRLKWYGHRGKRIEYILIALLTVTSSLQILLTVGGKAGLT
jgi:hypothetical protein